MQVDGELDAFDRRASLLGLIAVRAGEAILAVRAKPSRRKATSKNLAVWAMMGVIVGMMMTRAWTISGIQTFLPTWFDELGYNRLMQSALVTTLLLSMALGTW